MEGIFRYGEVVSINADKCTVRVQFQDMDDFISGDLFVLQNKTHKDKYYFLPDVGELVVCVLIEYGGFVLGSIYNQKDMPVILGENKSGISYEDGSEIVYNKESGKLSGKFANEVNISSDSKVSFSSGEFNVACGDVKLGEGASVSVVHELTLCPIFGVPIGSVGPKPAKVIVPNS